MQYKNLNLEFGLCMAGVEMAFIETLLDRVAASKERACELDRLVNYMEIGVAEGKTLSAVCAVLRESCGSHWNALGIDIPKGWSLDERAARERISPYLNARLELAPSYQVLTTGLIGNRLIPIYPIDFAFVDGCHGKACVKADFIALTRHMRPGGVVCFHDALPQDQGYHMQPHCGTGIAVREGLRELGLLENKLPGWKLLREVPGDKTKEGNGIVMVQYTGF